MKRVAFVTATPSGINPGMLAGEAAARSFASRAGLLPDCAFYRVHALPERMRQALPQVRDAVLAGCDLGIPFETLEHPTQIEDLVPVFWGDFQHMRRHIQAVARETGRAEGDVRDLLLLAGGSDPLRRRAISYGTSFLFNSTADYRSPEYGADFRRFFAQAFHVQLRDAVSAAVASGLRSSAEGCFGIDPAQALAVSACEADIVGWADSPPPSGPDRALLFFARARHDRPHLEAFVAAVVQEVGATAAWLPWGDTIAFPFRGDEFGGDRIDLAAYHGQPGHPLSALLRAIRGARCILTDTYHLAVVGWALGVPTIMLRGDHHERERETKDLGCRVRHDKRKILYGQDGLLDFFIEPALIAEAADRHLVAARLAEEISAGSCAREFRARLAARAAVSEDRLRDAIHRARSAG